MSGDDDDDDERDRTHPTVLDFEFGVLKAHLKLFGELVCMGRAVEHCRHGLKKKETHVVGLCSFKGLSFLSLFEFVWRRSSHDDHFLSGTRHQLLTWVRRR